MTIRVSQEKFNKEWKPTVVMEKEKEGVFVQTYEHKRFQGFFKATK